MNNSLKLLRKFRPSEGFTLVELLLASAMTVVVVGGAGYGLLSILNSDKIANANSQTQQMLNLGVEFVTDEIQSAVQIDSAYDPSTAAQFEKIKNSSDIPVLSLQMTGLSERIIYYTRDMSAEKSPTWAGPTVLYRFGPYLKNLDDGTCDGKIPPDNSTIYCNPTDPTQWGSGDALIDLIGSRQNLTDAKAPMDCSDPTWTRMPPKNGADDKDLRGFFVCVRPKGDVAEIRALSAMGIEKNTSVQKPVSYQLTTQAVARSTENADLDGDGAILNPVTMKPNMPVKIVGKAIYTRPGCKTKSNPTIRMIGDGGSYKSIEISQTLGTSVEGLIQVNAETPCPDSVTYFSYQDQGLTAKNGDTLSSLISKANPAYTGTDSQRAATIKNLETILGSTYLDSKTGKIKLPSNQNLFFMSNFVSTWIAVNPQTYDQAIILTTVNRQ